MSTPRWKVSADILVESLDHVDDVKSMLSMLSTCKTMRAHLGARMVARIFHIHYFRPQYFQINAILSSLRGALDYILKEELTAIPLLEIAMIVLEYIGFKELIIHVILALTKEKKTKKRITLLKWAWDQFDPLDPVNMEMKIISRPSAFAPFIYRRPRLFFDQRVLDTEFEALFRIVFNKSGVLLQKKEIRFGSKRTGINKKGQIWALISNPPAILLETQQERRVRIAEALRSIPTYCLFSHRETRMVTGSVDMGKRLYEQHRQKYQLPCRCTNCDLQLCPNCATSHTWARAKQGHLYIRYYASLHR